MARGRIGDMARPFRGRRAQARVATRDAIPGEVGGEQPAALGRLDAVAVERALDHDRLFRPPQDHPANQGVEPRPGQEGLFVGVDGEHRDPPPAHPPLDRQELRAGLAQGDRRRARPWAQDRQIEGMARRRPDRHRRLVLLREPPLGFLRGQRHRLALFIGRWLADGRRIRLRQRRQVVHGERRRLARCVRRQIRAQKALAVQRVRLPRAAGHDQLPAPVQPVDERAAAATPTSRSGA